MNKHRISTNIGKDQFVNVELKQEFDLLEILSLKFTQKDIYTSYCADYGVVVGRISVNNGLGVPNARVSIFIPLSAEDEEDPVISALYPYTNVTDKNEEGYRYNLLPERKQHGGHEPTGTFPDQTDILYREEVLEVYEKYYKYTVKTNESGDFMIWGVPVGSHTLHIDVDLSDIGEYSLRPYDFMRKGVGEDAFKNSYSFKSSTDIDDLPQIVSTDKTIEVYPFWGSEDLCEIGITRSDFDLSSQGIYIEPKAYVMGSIFSDSGKNSVNKNCQVQAEMGRKCNLISTTGTIEAIRYTPFKDSFNRPILEEYQIQKTIEDDGSFVLPLPMNMDYKYTNEFGDIEYTTNKDKGVATSACYRLRFTAENNESGRVRHVATYLAPNIREYNNSTEDKDKSYAWSLDWDDYPSLALTDEILFNHVDGRFYPQDYFYRFTGNKVYSVSSFLSSYFSTGTFGHDTFIGIKQIAPNTEDDCDNNVSTPPINFGLQNFTFSVLLAIVIGKVEEIFIKLFMYLVQVLIIPFQTLYSLKILGIRPFKFLDGLIESLQDFGTMTLSLIPYPFCEKCEEPEVVTRQDLTDSDESNVSDLYKLVMTGDAYEVNSVDPDLSTNIRKQVILGLPESSGTLIKPDTSVDYSEYNLETITQSTDFIIVFYVQGDDGLEKRQTNLSLEAVSKIFYENPEYYYMYTDFDNLLTDNNSVYNYEIYDTTQSKDGTEISDTEFLENLQTECSQYNKFYNEEFTHDLTVGQAKYKKNKNRCGRCGTESGFSEIKNGVVYLIPAASVQNWGANNQVVTEYANRKLIGKLFCGGIVNYAFIDNWLHGALYFFQFKAKVRWDNEDDLDLSVRRTKYCDYLLYYKIDHKRFYYRSTKTISGVLFEQRERDSLGYPTTFMDLGVRDEFIKEITINKDIDPNSSVIRNIGPTSYQNFKEMMALYISYMLDKGNGDVSYRDFFKNRGYDSHVQNKFEGKILNGDISQLISINSEVGIEEFDLYNRYYGAYQPNVLDFEIDNGLLDGGPYPINLVLDDGEGYRVRDSINNSTGNTVNASQYIPFYLWDKKGEGFGEYTDRFNQSWFYDGPVQYMKSQHMEFNYAFNTEDDYILFPMTKTYGGKLFDDVSDAPIVDVVTDIESLTDNHTDYNKREEGFTFLYITGGTIDTPAAGRLYTRVGNEGTWEYTTWTSNNDFIIKPTQTNYIGEKQILSTPFLYYFGLRNGRTAYDKFVDLFGPKGAFPSAE